MRTLSRNATVADTSRSSRNAVRVGEQKKRPAPSGSEEGHLGAREDQMSVTMPPKGDDDEPKQG